MHRYIKDTCEKKSEILTKKLKSEIDFFFFWLVIHGIIKYFSLD